MSTYQKNRGDSRITPTMMLWITVAIVLSMMGCNKPAGKAASEERLENSSRKEMNGWIYVHLEGSPENIGFQHGYLLAEEIADALEMFKMYLPHKTKKDWQFYRGAVERMFWNKLDDEYKQEIRGIAEGLQAKGKLYDTLDVTVLNGRLELAGYYVPWLQSQTDTAAKNRNTAPGRCSAFIATGGATKDGRIVIGHNAWDDYVAAERWNIIADIVPEKGHRILMDTYPGFIHSGDDFNVTEAGLLVTETTITQFKGFDTTGIPEFVRARKAVQYANSIDEWIKIMTDGNNGGYANDWLVGDIKTGEIARLELGLKHTHVWRTFDGYFVGANFPSDSALTKDETTFRFDVAESSPNVRRNRWEALMKEYYGKIDVELGKKFLSDHFYNGKESPNAATLCGHIDLDKRGAPEWECGPYYPSGAVQAKVSDANLAREMKLWGCMGHPCGMDFIAKDFLAKHPEYNWQEKFLKDMKSGEWTLFASEKR